MLRDTGIHFFQAGDNPSSCLILHFIVLVRGQLLPLGAVFQSAGGDDAGAWRGYTGVIHRVAGGNQRIVLREKLVGILEIPVGIKTLVIQGEGGGETDLLRGAVQADEAGQGGNTHGIRLQILPGSLRHILGSKQIAIGGQGGDVGNNPLGPVFFPVLINHTYGFSVLQKNPLDAAVEAYHAAHPHHRFHNGLVHHHRGAAHIIGLGFQVEGGALG